MTRAAFLDRDGVINRKAREGEYITSWDEIEILPGVVEAINLLEQAGFRVIVVTNQRCVAKGLISTAELELLHLRMRDELSQADANIDAIYYCPHEKIPVCQCRKPAPGMLLTAAHEHGLDLTASWMIGDSELDMQAGKSAGCRTAYILDQGQTGSKNADVFAHSLLDAVQSILQWTPRPENQAKRDAENAHLHG